MMMRSNTLLASGLCLVLVGSAHAATRNYDATYTSNPATIDGVISAGEWDDAAMGGSWVLLRENGKADAEGNYFKAKWDSDGIYVLHGSNYGGWNNYTAPSGPDAPDWGGDQINFFFDPNPDNEPLIQASELNDHYQILFNQYTGTASWDGAAYSNTNAHMVLASNNAFGGSGIWDGPGADSRMMMINGASGGVFEMFMSWEDFNYGADNPNVNDLAIDGAPALGDEWMYNCSRISTDTTNNYLPVWQDSGDQSFINSETNGWATMTFTPEPASLAMFGVMSALFLRRRK